MSEQVIPLSTVFQGVVDRINKVENIDPDKELASPASFAGLLTESKAINAEMLGIVERLSMALSTVQATAAQCVQGIGQLKGSPAGDRCATALAPAVHVVGQVNEAFADEISFAGRINQLVSQKILSEAGVNPNDPEAVAAYVKQNLSGQ